tara:strand:+ start:516 stop:809 length:294 start_codon:yes stop_codon:yes gene_type:complete
MDFHTIQSSLPYMKDQFIKAQRNGILTPAVVASNNANYLHFPNHENSVRRHRVKHFTVGKKGTKSTSRKGDKNFTTKRGDKDFHRSGHNVKRGRTPY